ncbi:MAG: orotidine-5'-phosphate decarboxylase [Candidatus Pelagisphaera sp.]|jgi:orotidine-5'-phosphate decarboxylase
MHGDQFQLVTPGIRPTGADAGDQKRIMTPQLAAEQGADYIVVGRPIYQANNPAAVVAAIRNDLR